MPQTQSLGLADVHQIHALGQNILCQLKQGIFVFALQFGFQLIRFVEMVFYAALIAACNEYYVSTTCFYGLFHCILNQGLIDDGQHFFRAGLGCRQEAGTHACHWKHRFFDFLHYPFPNISNICCSFNTATPKASALANLLPAASPATT